MSNLKIYLLKKLNMVGGAFIALGIPFHSGGIIVKDNPLTDLLFIPVGIVLMIISYYYTFIYEK